MKRGKRYKIVALAMAFALFVALACTSLSKFVFRQEDYIVGSYTDFVISHDGEGQTAVLQSIEDTEGYNYEGYIALSVSNFTENKFSKRDVEFSLRAPTDEENTDKQVTDAWGNRYSLAEHSGNYTVDIVGQAEGLSTLEGGKKDTEYLTLRIRRKSSAEAISDTAEEYLTVILETTRPYRDLQVFKINASTSLISVNAASEQDYHGVPQIAVNLKTSRLFVRESESVQEERTYIAQVKFTLSGSVVFDAARFEENYSVKVISTPEQASGETVYTFLVPSGSDMNLYFYTSGICSVTALAEIDEENTKISGVKPDGTVFSIG